jgi:hypothetical protein
MRIPLLTLLSLISLAHTGIIDRSVNGAPQELPKDPPAQGRIGEAVCPPSFFIPLITILLLTLIKTRASAVEAQHFVAFPMEEIKAPRVLLLRRLVRELVCVVKT